MFENIDYSGLQSIFNDAIGSMLDAAACTVPCTLEYGVTKYEACTNCRYDPIGRKSANIYQDGGPMPFAFGSTCPACGGSGKRAVISTEEIRAIVVYEPKDFMNFSKNLNHADGYIQTMGKISLMPKFQQAQSIIVATNIGSMFTRKYQRITEPVPCSFSDSSCCVCTWKRI